MPLKKLPDGRLIEEKEIDLDPPPVGNVQWKATKIEPVLVKTDNEEQAKQKGALKLSCETYDIFDVKPFGDYWKVSKTVDDTIVIAHTFFGARQKAMRKLGCEPENVRLEQLSKSANDENILDAEGSKKFDPWEGSRMRPAPRKVAKRRSKKSTKSSCRCASLVKNLIVFFI